LQELRYVVLDGPVCRSATAAGPACLRVSREWGGMCKSEEDKYIPSTSFPISNAYKLSPRLATGPVASNNV
jgi:hypothetical protein